MEKSIGTRMKEYEEVTNFRLTNKIPVIIRLDGRSFHTFTKGFKKPFDDMFAHCMEVTMKRLCEEISGCIFGYTQSDEITLVLIDDKNNKGESNPWFDNRVQKIASVSAGMATLYFNEAFEKALSLYDQFVFSENACWEDEEDFRFRERKKHTATFDSRVFNIPENEVLNNLIWRQNDATKNSINSLAQSHFKHRELQNKTTSEMQNMLLTQKSINWNDTPTRHKRGCSCVKVPTEVQTPHGVVIRNKWVIDKEMPILTQNPDYINNLFKEN